ncbi:TrmB family transcriptional regulator [Haloarchaeobius sp. HME9146]|uniref:TrmB family transcriptional regulator n=1 Tax=Haloarchaeobius sp. HME9146 TaxID=2978732 RepID=UPI0021C1AA4B|nr:helix-turn-helix domain-containing protein [Haloarchaeobius sp. HME9146]MCT9097091.1 TrmB family transcriptional regulator [Haloarchaeobius sp. HME9146]
MTANEDEAIDSLERLGLTSYEAKVFIALQKLGTGTAREVSRVADVPRSQVYSVTEGLEERGLIEVQQSSPMQYRPVSTDEARSMLRERFERESDQAFDYVETVREQFGDDQEEQEAIWTIRGRERISDRAADLIRRADESVAYAAASPELVTEDITEALRACADRGLETAVLSEEPAVRELFADEPGIRTDEPANPHKGAPDEGGPCRGVFVDDDALLLSVVGHGQELPGIDRETAFWSEETNFAKMLIQLAKSAGGPVE